MFKKTTHRCPECLGNFFGPAHCRGTMDKGFHDPPVQTLPVIGCEEPPTQSYSIMLRGVAVIASTPTQAREMALTTVADYFGGNTKRAQWAMDRIGFAVDAVPDDPQRPAGPVKPAVLAWKPDEKRVAREAA